MLRWSQLLSILAGAASLVVLAAMVWHGESVWRTAMVSGAAACIFVALAFSTRRPSTASSSPSASPQLISPAAPPSSVGAEVLAEKVSGDPLQNKPWLNLVGECVDLYDELERLQPSLDGSAQELVDHCRCRLLEILERCGVTIVADDAAFDRARHQAAAGEIPHEGTPIEATLSPGFAVGRRVFRRARVKLALSLLPTQEPSP